MTLEELTNLLTANKIDTKKWNSRGGTRTVQDLLNEINNGETTLAVKNDVLTRTVKLVVVNITYHNKNGNVLRLKEDKQISKIDGAVKIRPHIRGSLSEKMKFDEDPIYAAKRGVAEELGVTGGLEFTFDKTLEKEKPSSNFPQLKSIYIVNIVTAQMNDSVFVPNNDKGYSYKEEQTDKTTYFVWEDGSTYDNTL